MAKGVWVSVLEVLGFSEKKSAAPRKAAKKSVKPKKKAVRKTKTSAKRKRK